MLLCLLTLRKRASPNLVGQWRRWLESLAICIERRRTRENRWWRVVDCWRLNSNRPLRELAPQAEAIMAVALERAGLRPADLEECPPLDGRTGSKTA